MWQAIAIVFVLWAICAIPLAVFVGKFIAQSNNDDDSLPAIVSPLP